jgi:hypothetical protein
MHEFFLLIPLAITYLQGKNIIENFDSGEKCDITDNKLKLLEEKITLESKQNQQIPNEKITERLKEIETQLDDLDNKLSSNIDTCGDFSEQIKKSSETQKEFQEKIDLRMTNIREELVQRNKKIEEDELYKDVINWNTFNTNLFNIILFLILGVLLFLIFSYIYSLITTFIMKRNLKIDKISGSYEDILEEIKKSKMKDNLKIKRGSFFNFLDQKTK